MKKIYLLFILLLSSVMLFACASESSVHNDADASNDEVDKTSRLHKIIDDQVIRVGTTGDYRPFTYLNPDTGEFEGFDIDAAKKLAEDLGVEVEFVQTSWPDLMDDLLDDKFDIGMGGITRTLERQKTAHMSQGYYDFGKSALIHQDNKDKFKSIEDLNKPDVKVGVNPGGTNFDYVEEHLTETEVIIIENNLEIPEMVAEKEVDVMITETPEALLYAKEDSRLYPAFVEEPLTNSQMGYIMHQGDPTFHNWIDLWIKEMELSGEFEKLEEKWMK